jgi:hypothetical protein
MTMADLKTEFLFELRIPQKQEDIVDMGQTPVSRLLYSVAESGSFEGPKLKGKVIPLSGGDWSRVRADMSIAIDVRICLKTQDGANILMTYRGVLAANSLENFQYMIDSTKKDDPKAASERYYYRTLISFETGDERYAWLNRTVAVGSGRLGDNQVIYEVFAVR